MRKFLLTVLFIAAVVLVPAAASAQTLRDIIKIGIVDMEKLFNEYASKSRAAVQLREQKAEYAKEIRLGLRQIKQMEESLQANSGILTNSEKRRRMAEIEYKKEELSSLIAMRNLQLAKEEEGLTQPILKEIYDAIRAVSARQGIKLVFDSRAGIAFHDMSLDITSLVMNRLRLVIIQEQKY
jgi:Skp family chaperone for outer membrane proteins